jgi:Mitochondrial carrier protein
MSEEIHRSAAMPLGPLDTPIRHGEVVRSKGASEPNKHHEPLNPMAHVLVAGGVGGAVGDTVMYPLDTVKTRQQGASNIEEYRSMRRASLMILRTEGIFRGIYSGYLPALIGSFPSTMAFFGAYELTKRKMIIDWDLNDTFSHLTAGLVGDLVSSVIYVPSEVLKTRLQLQGRYNNPYFQSGYNYKGMMDATRTIIRSEGWGAMFYGYKATLIRDLPFSALQLAFYEKLHAWAQAFVGKGVDMGIGLELVTGGMAGGIAGVITTPLDVVKTRVQTQHPDQVAGISSGSTKGPVTIANSTWSGLRTIYKAEGLGRVFSGVGPRLIWTSTQSSVMLFMYQTVLKFLKDFDDRKTNPM